MCFIKILSFGNNLVLFEKAFSVCVALDENEKQISRKTQKPKEILLLVELREKLERLKKEGR